MIHFSMDRITHTSRLFDIVRRQKLQYEEVPVNIRYTDYSLRKGQSVWDSVKVLRSRGRSSDDFSGPGDSMRD